MKLQSIKFGEGNTFVFVYDYDGNNKASAEFIVFAKKIVDELERDPKSSCITIYLQHYLTKGSLISRGVDACNLLITDKVHRAEVKFSIDSLRKVEYEIHDDIMEQWNNYLSLTKSIPFEIVI